MICRITDEQWAEEWPAWVEAHGNARPPAFGRTLDGGLLHLHDTFADLDASGARFSAVRLVAWLDKVHEAGSVARALRKYRDDYWHGGGYERINRLEKRVGSPLFIRNARPFTLTPAGEKLIRRYVGYDE